MATTTLNTRIISKHITLEQANTGTWAPYEGEIVLARVDTTTPNGHGGVTVVPTYLMKVGAKDGEGNLIAIKDLKWTHAPASDVYTWAKQQKLAITTNGEGNVISNIVATDAGITITKAIVATTSDIDDVEEAIEALQTALNTEIADRAAADTALGNRVTAVEDSLKATGDTGKAIAAAQSAADAANDAAVAAQDTIDEYKTANNAAVALKADQTALDAEAATRAAAITGLETAYKAADTAVKTELIGATGDAKTADTIKGAKAYADDVATTKAADAQSGAEATAAAALNTAKTDLQGKIDAVDDKVDALDTAYKAADTTLGNRVSALESTIQALEGTTHFIGVKTSLPATANDGDICIVGNKEYVYDSKAETGVTVDGTQTQWVELGDTTAELAAIDALEKKVNVTDVQQAIHDAVAVETGNRTAADTAINSAIDDINDKLGGTFSAANNVQKVIDDALAAAKEYADEQAEAAEYDDTEVRGLISAMDAAYKAADATIEGKIEPAKQAAISAANTYTDGKISEVNGTISALDTAYKAADTALSTRVKAIEDDYLKASDKTALQGEISEVATDLSTLSGTVTANKLDVDTNFVKAVNGALTLNGLTLILDCGGAEQ